MAIKAIDLYRRVIVAGATEVLWVCDRHRLAIGAIHCMALNAPFEAEAPGVNAFMDRGVTLMPQRSHVVATHPLRVGDALFPLAARGLWQPLRVIGAGRRS